MRITKYTTRLDEDKKPQLVKESAKNYPASRLNSPLEIVNMMNEIFHADRLTEEYVWMLAMDTKCRLIGMFELSHGTVNASLVNPREVFMKLCLCGATNFVLVHNHPSGDNTPSCEDNSLTQRIKDCGKLMGVSLLDHIIIGDGYYSFAECKTL